MTLPVLVSVPHGGGVVPEEISDRVCITPEDLFDDGDACTLDIYGVGGEVLAFQAAEIARAFVDLNRAPDDRPPANPDGVVKTATCYGRPIYGAGRELTPELTDLLVARYHAPYHRALAVAGGDPRLRFALDCHSMAEVPPVVAPDSRPRPLFCLSNGEGATAPAELVGVLREALVETFRCRPEDVRINEPFKGGFITRSHGGGTLPWIQVEMNRSLYLAPAWFDRGRLAVSAARLSELRGRFMAALRLTAGWSERAPARGPD